jgi:hypothetical protein
MKPQIDQAWLARRPAREQNFDEMEERRAGEPAPSISEAVAQVEKGLEVLGRACLHEAQQRAGRLRGNLRDRWQATEAGFESWIARVPAVGPTLAMELYRATHPAENENALAVRPSNVSDMPEPAAASGPTLEYVELIGLRIA